MKRRVLMWAALLCSRSDLDVFFFDYDLDGWPDILVVNGHIDPDIQKVQINVKYAEARRTFSAIWAKEKFAEVTKSAGRGICRGAPWGVQRHTPTFLMMGGSMCCFPRTEARCIFFEMLPRRVLPPPRTIACDSN